MIDVVLPALDEVAVIASVVARMPPGFRAIVVDNGSSDGTGEAAARRGRPSSSSGTRVRRGVLRGAGRGDLGRRVLHGRRWLARSR